MMMLKVIVFVVLSVVRNNVMQIKMGLNRPKPDVFNNLLVVVTCTKLFHVSTSLLR